jgi:hypothetical protein
MPPACVGFMPATKFPALAEVYPGDTGVPVPEYV